MCLLKIISMSAFYKGVRNILIKEDIMTTQVKDEMLCRILPVNLNTIYLMLAVKHGSLNDVEFSGTAHFLEHMLLEFYNNNYNKENNISVKGTTIFNRTMYTIICENNVKELEIAVKVLRDISLGHTLNSANLSKVRQDIISEYISITSTPYYDMYYDLTRKSGLSTDLPIGSLESISHISYSDISSSFNAGYNYDNMGLFIVGAEKTILNKAIDIFNTKDTRPSFASKPRLDSNINVKSRHDCYYDLSKTLQKYYYVFFRLEEVNNNFGPYIDILDNISLTLIEEKVINHTCILQNEIITNLIQYTSDYKFYRIILRKDHILSQSALSLIENITLNENDLDLIEEVIQAYRSFLKSESFNGYEIIKHMGECFVFDQPIYDNYDLIKQLNNITSTDVLTHSLRILNATNKYEYCIGA